MTTTNDASWVLPTLAIGALAVGIATFVGRSPRIDPFRVQLRERDERSPCKYKRWYVMKVSPEHQEWVEQLRAWTRLGALGSMPTMPGRKLTDQDMYLAAMAVQCESNRILRQTLAREDRFPGYQ